MEKLTLESIVHRSIVMHPSLLAETLTSAAVTLRSGAAECEPGHTRRGVEAFAKAALDSAAWLRDACGSDAYAAIIGDPTRLRLVARRAARLLCYTPATLSEAVQEYEAREAKA